MGDVLELRQGQKIGSKKKKKGSKVICCIIKRQIWSEISWA